MYSQEVSSSRSALAARRSIRLRFAKERQVPSLNIQNKDGLPRICKQMLAVTKIPRHCDPKQSISRRLCGYRLLPPQQVRGRSDAFTLIELSIVLVIIGLIVGGVLVGQDLIEAAKTRSLITQIEKMNVAVNTFKLKYNYMPGDIPNAVALGLGTNTAWHNGDGNGKLDNYCYANTLTWGDNFNKESLGLVMHLGAAGLIEGTYEGYAGEAHGAPITDVKALASLPESKYNDNFFVVATQFSSNEIECGPLNNSHPNSIRDGGHGWFLLPKPPSSGGYIASSLTEAVVWQIDSKVDDGLPLTGRIGLMHNAWASTAHVISATVSGYTNTYSPNSTTLVRPAFVNQY